jgi:hypothetical protein
MFLDGKSDGTATFASDLLINNSTLRIGGHYGGNTTFDTDGFIDDFRIYNRALTETEIRQLASKRGIGLQPRPKQYTYYQFPSGSKRRRLLTGMP